MKKNLTCGILLYCVPQEKFLLGHATMSKNQWSVPKGQPEDGEELLQAAFRETREETGIDLRDLGIDEISEIEEIRYARQNKYLKPFLIKIKEDITGLPLKCSSLTPKGYPEIDRFAWVDVKDFHLMAHETQSRALTLYLEKGNRL